MVVQTKQLTLARGKRGGLVRIQMLAAILRARHVRAQIMDEHGAAMTIRLIGTACMPAMTVEDQHIARLTFDHDLIRMRSIWIGQDFLRAFSKQMRTRHERCGSVRNRKFIQHPDRGRRTIANLIPDAALIRIHVERHPHTRMWRNIPTMIISRPSNPMKL